MFRVYRIVKRLIIILLSVFPLVAWAQEEATQSWEDNDSVVMAPLQVKAVGTNTYEDEPRAKQFGFARS